MSTRTLDGQQITNGANTLTVPSGVTTTLVGRSTTDTLTNKTLDGGSNTFTNIPVTSISGFSAGVNDDVGTIFSSGSSTVPQGCLLADGSAVSRTTYAALFSKIGTTYGVGDGSTTFNLPNGQGVFIRGQGSQTISGKSYSATAGTTSTDMFQSHYHAVQLFGSIPSQQNLFPTTNSGSIGNGSLATATGTSIGTNGATILTPTSDGTNGTPRVGAETYPANIAAYVYIRYQASGGGVTPPTSSYYSGYFVGSGGYWSTSSTSFADPTASGSPSLTSRVSNGITVTAAASNLPGITFTPASATAIYLITATSMLQNGAAGAGGSRLIDSNGVVINSNGFSYAASGGYGITLMGVYAPGTSSAVTVKIQVISSSGSDTIYLGNNTGLNAISAMEWTVLRIF